MDKKTKVLIVEDDVPTATMIVHILSRANCNVIAVHTGKKGTELATESKFDLIILDVDLPDTTGFEICRNLKERHFTYRTPVVFISGRPAEQYGQRASELGAVDYIEKPFAGIDLVSRLLSHVKTKSRSILTNKTICD